MIRQAEARASAVPERTGEAGRRPPVGESRRPVKLVKGGARAAASAKDRPAQPRGQGAARLGGRSLPPRSSDRAVRLGPGSDPGRGLTLVVCDPPVHLHGRRRARRVGREPRAHRNGQETSFCASSRRFRPPGRGVRAGARPLRRWIKPVDRHRPDPDPALRADEAGHGGLRRRHARCVAPSERTSGTPSSGRCSCS